MGSFNTTCAVSKTSILSGQKARVFFLVRNTSAALKASQNRNIENSLMGFSSFPWTHFKVIGYPLLAEYDDFNRYNFEDSEMAELTLKHIDKIYIPTKHPKKENELIESIQDMNTLQEMEHLGCIKVKSKYGVTAIAKMAIHEDIYQNLILNKDSGFFKKELESRIKENSLINSNMIEKKEWLSRYQNLLKTLDIDKDTLENQTRWAYEHLSLFQESNKIKHNVVQSSAETNYYKDISSLPFSDKIIEAFLGLDLTTNWFFNNNLEFLPVLLSSQVDNFEYISNNMMEMAKIIKKLKTM